MLMRMMRWIIAGVLILLPVQTHWLISQPRVLGSVWEFGSARLLVMECIVAGLALVLWLPWWRARSYQARVAMIVGIAGIFVWSVMVSGGAIVALVHGVHAVCALLLGVLLFQSVTLFGSRWVLSWFVAGGVLWAGLGLVQWFTQSVIASTYLGIAAHAPEVAGDAVVMVRDTRMLRVYGPMPHPNIFGGLMVAYCYAALLLLRTLSPGARVHRALVVAALTLTSVALVLSFSRSAWLAGIVLLLVAVPWRAWKSWIRTLVVPTIAVVIVVLLLGSGITSRLQTHTPLESQSRNERVESVRDGLSLVAQAPALGTGLGLATASLHANDDARVGWSLQPPHFTPLLLLVELGFVGALIFALCAYFLPWHFGLLVLIPGLFFDHYLWSLPAGLTVLTAIWILSTIQARLALESTEC